jgi:Uma2 family endonuclease
LEGPRLKLPDGQYFMPDLAVVPSRLVMPHLDSPDSLEEYVESLPLVLEVWSKSTGEYDVTTKLPGYQQRGDEEVWLLHPYDRWLRRWCRERDGYREERVASGRIALTGLPGVSIDLDGLFRRPS